MFSGVLVELVESRGFSVDGEESSALTGREVEIYRDLGRRFSLTALYGNVSRRQERTYNRHGTNDTIVAGCVLEENFENQRRSEQLGQTRESATGLISMRWRQIEENAIHL